MVARPFLNMVGKTFYDTEPKAVPIPLVLEAISKCKYGSIVGLSLQFRFYTGCRGEELNKINPNNQSNGYIFWELGKNQVGFRREFIPEKWWAEYDFYRHQQGVPSSKLFHITNNTIRDYFNRHLRPRLSKLWQEKVPVMRSGQISLEYRYSWGGLRKTFQTLLFAHFWQKYNDASIALEMVSKRMHHSSGHMTIKHYIENAENIQAKSYLHLLPFEIASNIPRQSMLEYFT